MGIALMLEHIFVSVSAASLLVAAMKDARVRVIPNTCVIFVAACGLFLRALDSSPSVVNSLAATGAILLVCVWLFQSRLLGGGDAKLIPAASLLFPPDQIATFLVVTAMMGGVLAIFALSTSFIRSKSANGRFFEPVATDNDGVTEFGFQDRGIPYGVAIFSGVIITMAMTL